MKNLKLLFIAFLAITTISSCSKDSDNGLGDYEENLKRIDSILKAQAPILKEYAEQNFGENAKIDSTTGIWYEVLESTVDSTYEYIKTGNSWVPVVATINYKGELMNGTEFDSRNNVEMEINRVIPAWLQIFYPENNSPNALSGILPHGLLIGNKIRFIAPSPYCYDNKPDKNGKIPVNSPLIFNIEVLKLKSAN